MLHRSMIQNVYLIETVAEARALMEHLGKQPLDPSSNLVLGLEPQSRACLQQHGWPSQDTVAYFDRDAHIQGSRHVGMIQRLVANDFALDLNDGLGETYANRFEFNFLFYYRQLIRFILIMDSVQRAHPNADWHIVETKPAHRPFDILASHFCATRAVSLHRLQMPLTTSSPRATSKLKEHLGHLLDALVCRAYQAILARLKKTMLVATPAMHMAKLTQTIRQDHPDVTPVFLRFNRFPPAQELVRALFWLIVPATKTVARGRRLLALPMAQCQTQAGRKRKPHIRKKIDQAVARFLAANAEALSYCGVSCADMLLDQTGWFSDRLVPLYDLGQAEAKLLDGLKPSLILSPSSGQVYHLLGNLARERHIPAVVIPFKTLAPPRNDIEAVGTLQIGQDMITDIYPIAVAQSPMVRAYMGHVGYAGRVIPSTPLLRTHVDTGSRSEQRERLRDRVGPFEQMILYAPSMKPVPPFFVVHTLDEVIQSMADMIRVTTGMPGARLVLRLHPDLATLQNDLETLLTPPQHATLDSGTQDSFADLLPMADLLVTNMSTVAEEAIYNGIPVVLYDKWSRYNHLDAPQVQDKTPTSVSPAYYVGAEEKLRTTIEWLLEHHPPGLELPQAAKERYMYLGDERQNLGKLMDELLS